VFKQAGITRMIAGAAVAVVVVIAPSAEALAAPDSSHNGRSHSKTVSAGDIEQAKKTPIEEIVRKAKPLPIPRGKSVPTPSPEGGAGESQPAPQGADGPTVAVGGTSPASGSGPSTTGATAAVSQNGKWTGSYNSNPNRQVGKLYFDILRGPGRDWRHCSATAVNSENKSVVVTAGHCVYDPDPDGNGYVGTNGYWFEGVQFCPGYEYGCKLGRWFARQAPSLYTTGSWFSGVGGQYDWRDDMGAVIVSPNTRGRVVNVVGGQGIMFNTTVNRYRHAFGYPLRDSRWPAYEYDGEDLIYCPGTDTYYTGGFLRINCTMTGGASGGPWIHGRNSSWIGYVNSVNSHKPWGGAYVGGPYFGTAESNLFRDTRNS
jgi:hypothetical protein